MSFLDAVKEFLGIERGPISRSMYFCGDVESCIMKLSVGNSTKFLQVVDKQVDSHERGNELNQLWELVCRENSTVSALDVEQLDMSETQISKFLNHIENSKSIEFLKVSSSGFKEFGMIKLWEMLAKNKSLTVLECRSYNVQRHFFSPVEIYKMIDALKINKTLKKLYLPDNEISSVLNIETDFDKKRKTFFGLAMQHSEKGDKKKVDYYLSKINEIENDEYYKKLSELRSSGRIDPGIERLLQKVWLCSEGDKRLKESRLCFNRRTIGCFDDYFRNEYPLLDAEVQSEELSTSNERAPSCRI